VFTRCPACHTVHPINAELLARGGGKFRCGKCRKVSNALEALFDQWPDASQQGQQAGELPELGMSLSLNAGGGNSSHPEDAVAGDDAVGAPTDNKRSGSAWIRVLWIAAALVLTLVPASTLRRLSASVLQHPVCNRCWPPSVLNRLAVSPPPTQMEWKYSPARCLILTARVLLTTSIVSRPLTYTLPDVEVIDGYSRSPCPESCSACGLPDQHCAIAFGYAPGT
jgi:predicted Zn finger-like uncharacterized protein